ncbi:MAG TPA: beta-xylosidase [Opitutales bacterium]|nr:beta-xylosidase [Opitutales bacterium]
MNTSRWKLLAAFVLAAPFVATAQNDAAAPANPSAPFPVNITVDASKVVGPWKAVYRFFGADEPNYATMKDGVKLINELGQLQPGDVYYRAHNLLTTGDGTAHYKWGSTNAYTEDKDGKPIYNWTILDKIFDTYRAAGIHPYVQIGFMPEALSIHPEPYEHHWDPSQPYSAIYTGWAYPPKDYDKWEELCYQWAKHCLERYGKDEVSKWYWEVWNESNTQDRNGIGYWSSTPEEYYKLYDYASAGVRKAIPDARIGGADSAGNGGVWSRNFIQHCLTGTNFATGKVGSPLDFFSFHAKGTTPSTVRATNAMPAHTQMGIGGQLSAISGGFQIDAAYPELKGKPIVVGESDPDGCAACTSDALRDYRAGTVYAAYTAACIAREFELADRYGVNLEGALTWAFEFENEPYFKGQRVLATNGIDLPILDVFRMFAKMDGQRVTATSDHAIALDTILRSGVRTPGNPDVAALSTLAKNKLCVMVWHYHDEILPGPDATVSLDLTSLPKDVTKVKITHYRIDDSHSNSYTVWQRMGSPEKPTPEQYAQLEKAGQLETISPTPGAPTPTAANGELKLPAFVLPLQSVSLVVVEWQ